MVYALVPEMNFNGEPIAGFRPENDNYQNIELEDPTPDGGIYMSYGRALVSGRRIKLDHVPRQMIVENGSFLVDYTSSNGFQIVTEKCKSIVELVEPGVHQFVPFEAVDSRKSHVADLWIMIVCNRLDSVDRQRTTLVLRNGSIWCSASDMVRRGEEIPEGVDPSVPGKVFFDLSKIGSHHLWFDKHLGYQFPHISGALFDALTSADVSGASFVKEESV